MKDQNQTEMQLINELVELRKRIAELKTLENERKQTEEALRRSEERYRTILESIQEGYFEVDLAGNFTFLNDARCRELGYTRDELIGMNNRQYTDKETAKKVFQAFNKIYRTGEPVKGLDEEIIRKDGTKAFREISASLIRDSEGKPVGFRGISRDITERKRAEEEYRTILRTTMDGFWTADMHGRFLDVNDAYCQLIGYSRDELLTMRISDVEAVERPEETAQRIKRIMETGGTRFETRHRCKDGRMIDLEVSVNYTKIGNERLYVFLRDITERKRAEEALKGSEQRLADIIDFLPDATLVIDREGKTIAWNHAMEAMVGVKAKDMLGKGNREYAIPFYGERRPILIDLVTQPQEEIEKRYAHIEKRPGGVLMGESYIPNLKGGEFYFFGAAAPLYDQKGNLVGAIECIRDITERKRIEEEREKLICELENALSQIKQLKGLLPICMYCKKIRNDTVFVIFRSYESI